MNRVMRFGLLIVLMVLTQVARAQTWRSPTFTGPGAALPIGTFVCSSSSCSLSVMVVLLTKKGRCALTVSPNILVIDKKDQRSLVWTLSNQSPVHSDYASNPNVNASNFRFVPGAGVQIFGDDGNTEFQEGSQTIISGVPTYTATRNADVNKKPNSFNYNISIQFNPSTTPDPTKDAGWTDCGLLDPMVVNTAN